MKKKQAFQIAIWLSIFLLIIIIGTIFVSAHYGLGEKFIELQENESSNFLKEAFSNSDLIGTFSNIKGFKHLQKDHKLSDFLFFFHSEDIETIVPELNLSSKPIHKDLFDNVFFLFETPEWWQPDNVRQGYYYTGIYKNSEIHYIFDNSKKDHYIFFNNYKEKL